MSDPAPPPPPFESFEHGDSVGPVILGTFGVLIGLGTIMYLARSPERSWPEYYTHRSHSARKQQRRELVRQAVAEFVGTFFITATVELTAGQTRAPDAPIAIGSSLMVMTFALSHVSGAHFNPAITLAVLIRGAIAPIPAVVYLLAQLLAAFLGASLELMTLGKSCIEANLVPDAFQVDTSADTRCGAGFPYHNREYPTEVGFFTEMLYTFMLATVYLNVVNSNIQPKNHYFGLAVGFALAVGAFAAGNVSGGVLNPAVGTALPAIHGNHQSIWMYWTGPCLGATFAAVLFRFATGTGDVDRYMDDAQETPVSAR